MNEGVEQELLALLKSCPAEEDPALPEGVFHLVVADDDLTQGYRSKMTLCGATLSSSKLPPPCWGEGLEIGDDIPRFCPACAREAHRWRAEDALSAEAGAGGVR
ncbi:MAG: hypothetical protein ACRDRU_12375 [Pseudonocardiaceae bacterium]